MGERSPYMETPLKDMTEDEAFRLARWLTESASEELKTTVPFGLIMEVWAASLREGRRKEDGAA